LAIWYGVFGSPDPPEYLACIEQGRTKKDNNKTVAAAILQTLISRLHN
jgi:hypothetical protein